MSPETNKKCLNKRFKSIISFCFGIGLIVCFSQAGRLNNAQMTNAELEGSVKTTCRITSLQASPCAVLKKATRYSAAAIADACVQHFNKTISWKWVGKDDNCYTGLSGLPENDKYYQNMVWPCRANCKKELWYTDDLQEDVKLVNNVFIIGICIMSFSLLSICFYLYWCDEDTSTRKCAYTTILFFGFMIYFPFLFIFNLFCAKPVKKSAKSSPQLITAIQGEWHNSMGVYITVKDLQANFRPSGDHFKISSRGSNEVSMVIGGETWWLDSFDLEKVNSFPMQISWTSDRDGQKIRWNRFEDPEDPPAYQEAQGAPSGSMQNVDLQASAPPAYNK